MSRKGHADALVAKANADGSLEVRQSRALKTGNLTNLVIRLSLSISIGFLGLLSALRGAKRSGHALHVHQHHVGKDEQQVHAILASAGSRSALLLVRCSDKEMLKPVASATSKGAVYSWQGSLGEFLASLDPGSDDDWVRAAISKASD
jgi:hypothetical protein